LCSALIEDYILTTNDSLKAIESCLPFADETTRDVLQQIIQQSTLCKTCKNHSESLGCTYLTETSNPDLELSADGILISCSHHDPKNENEKVQVQK